MCEGAKDCAEQGNCLVVTYTDDYGMVYKRGDAVKRLALSHSSKTQIR